MRERTHCNNQLIVSVQNCPTIFRQCLHEFGFCFLYTGDSIYAFGVGFANASDDSDIWGCNRTEPCDFSKSSHSHFKYDRFGVCWCAQQRDRQTNIVIERFLACNDMFKICTQCCVSKIFCTSFSDRASDRHHATFGLHQLLAGIRAKSQQRLLRIIHFYDCEWPSIFWALCSIDDGYRGHAHDLLNKIMTVALRVQCHKCLAWLNLA